ncbi:MAG: hypothetical protein ILO36_00950 [Abditibacteriota bacterium]|nr:hypothetical protein [Abditibacteriota bacterium]
MKKAIACLFAVLLSAALYASAASPAAEVRAADFGVTADGTAPCAAALQKAIDSLPEGGGVVKLPAGVMVLEKTVAVPQRTVLEGEGASWENTSSTFHVKHKQGAAFTLASYSGVKGVAVYYPATLSPEKMNKPDLHDTCFEIRGCNVNLEYVNIDGAWIGVSSSRPRGSNAGQCLFSNINGFCHHRGFSMTGALDVNRFENVHFFPSRIGRCEGASYSSHNLIAFEFGRQDGGTFNSCFVIAARGFFRQNLTAVPGDTSAVISLGYTFTNCWIEAVDFGFDFRGVLGFTVLGCNVLVNAGGTGIIVRPEALGFNAVIKDTQVRGFAQPYTGIEYDYSGKYWPSFYTNKLTISDCVIQQAAPAVRLGPKAERVWVKDCLLGGMKGFPAVEIAKGARYFYVTDNVFQQTGNTPPVEDLSDTENKLVEGNATERL